MGGHLQQHAAACGVRQLYRTLPPSAWTAAVGFVGKNYHTILTFSRILFNLGTLLILHLWQLSLVIDRFSKVENGEVTIQELLQWAFAQLSKGDVLEEKARIASFGRVQPSAAACGGMQQKPHLRLPEKDGNRMQHRP